MRELKIPDVMSNLVNDLQLIEVTWRKVPIQIPRFAIYATIENPVFDSYMYREKRRVGLIKQKHYVIPVIDPFRGSIVKEPKYAVVVSHFNNNRFGLFAYPADSIEENISLPFYHRSVQHIIKDFI